MYDNQGYQNYRKLVKKLLKKVKKLDYKYNLSTTILMITKAYESLGDSFPKTNVWLDDNYEEITFRFCYDEDNITVWLITRCNDMSLKVINHGHSCGIVDICAYKEPSTALLFALKYRTEIAKPDSYISKND